MREIKFKAWDERGGEMIKSDFIIIGVNGLVFVSDEKNSRDYITLLQFTGLTDIIGKDIWEGDILIDSFSKYRKYEVKYVDGGFRCYPLWEEPKHKPFTMNQHDITVYLLEKIGNKYENPELLTN